MKSGKFIEIQEVKPHHTFPNYETFEQKIQDAANHRFMKDRTERTYLDYLHEYLVVVKELIKEEVEKVSPFKELVDSLKISYLKVSQLYPLTPREFAHYYANREEAPAQLLKVLSLLNGVMENGPSEVHEFMEQPHGKR